MKIAAMRPIKGASHQTSKFGLRLTGVASDAWTDLRWRYLWLYLPSGARSIKFSWRKKS